MTKFPLADGPLVRHLDSMDFGIRTNPQTPSRPGPDHPHHGSDDARAFLFAAALRDFARIRFLIEVRGLHPDTTVKGKPTAICYAVLKQDNCLLSYLIKRGANVNAADKIGMTPLHYAALGGSPYCIACLVRHGAQLQTRNLAGETPYSLIRNRVDLAECVDLLGRYGCRHIGQRQCDRSFPLNADRRQ